MADKGREVKATFKADTANFEKGSRKVKDEANTLEKALKKLGPVGSGIQGLLDKIGLSSVRGAVGVAAVGAAVGVATKVITDAIEQWSQFVSKIDDYQDVTSQSAEASSRQVVAFEELGVSAEVAGAGMFKLSQEIQGGNKNLEKYGIEVAKGVDGTVDLNATLLNIMDAYQSTSDATEKNAIVMAAFGKSGAAMIPILETNSAELKRLEAQVGKVVTDKDIADVREYRIAQRELKASTDELGLSLGQIFLPAAKDSVEAINENIYVQKRLAENTAETTKRIANLHYVNNQLTQSLKDEYRAAKDAQEETYRFAMTHKAAADAAQRDADAERTLYDAIHKSTDASFAYRQSLLDLKKAQKDAHDAKGKDAEANLRLEQAYHRAANAAVDLANDQRAANGQAALSTDEAVTIEIAALERLMKGMDKNSPLYKNLLAYIALLQKQVDLQRAAASTALSQTPSSILSRSGGGRGQLMDDGGTVPGPPGSLQPVLARGGEQFSGYPPKPMGGGTGGPTIVVNIHGGVFADHGPTLDKLAQAILQRARYAPGR